jgi:hypothetical protein
MRPGQEPMSCNAGYRAKQQQMGPPMKTIASFALFAALLTSPATLAQAPAPTPPPVTTGVSPSGARIEPPNAQRPPEAPGGRTVGQSTRGADLQDPKLDPVVRESEQEVSRRIKSICRGC